MRLGIRCAGRGLAECPRCDPGGTTQLDDTLQLDPLALAFAGRDGLLINNLPADDKLHGLNGGDLADHPDSGLNVVWP